LNITYIYNTGWSPLEQDAVTKADGFLILVDLTNRFSMERAKFYYRKIMQIQTDYYHAYIEEELMDFGVPLILIGTKSDLNEKRQITAVECLKLADSWSNCHYIEVCSIQYGNKGVESAFRELLSQISIKDKKRKSARSLPLNIQQDLESTTT